MRLWLLAVLLLPLVSACEEPEVQVNTLTQTVIKPTAAPPAVKPPVEAWQHRGKFKRDLIDRYGHYRWLNLFAAQINQESLWKADAVSWAGAEGCGQFMPSTQPDARYWARDLGDIDWFNCLENARASIRYMRVLFRRVKPPKNPPTNFNFDCYAYTEAIKDYNRGMGNGDKERFLGYCVRNARACDETETYIYRIVDRYQIQFFDDEYSPYLMCIGE